MPLASFAQYSSSFSFQVSLSLVLDKSILLSKKAIFLALLFIMLIMQLGMCFDENYSDSSSREYSRHYSAESEYLRHQNMDSKVITSVEVLISTQTRIKRKKKVKIIMV